MKRMAYERRLEPMASAFRLRWLRWRATLPRLIGSRWPLVMTLVRAMLALVALTSPTLVARAHPGNVIATLTPRADEGGIRLEAVLTFDGTGEPLLGAALSWTVGALPEEPGAGAAGAVGGLESGAAPSIPGTRFRFGGGANVRVATLPRPVKPTTYALHILSLGETTSGTFRLEPRGSGWAVEPRELLLVFPDVGIPDYQLVLIVLLVVIGMVIVMGRGAPKGEPPAKEEP